MIRKIGYSWFIALLSLIVSAQNADDVRTELVQYVQKVNSYAQYVPQEKVYVHFDNTNYYQGDQIWFKCYVVNSRLHRTDFSNTLYVELLSPGGDVIEKRILPIIDGQCHGDFILNQLPFFSGFYEVRAYTKYMLNFGEETIFSRLLPVFRKPKEPGVLNEGSMQKYGLGAYPVKRENPKKEKNVNVKFFPEGGNLVQGVTSQVAFEATDAFGNPIDISGVIINDEKEEIGAFTSVHEGRGVFTYTPGKEKRRVEVEYEKKKYRFDMPEALPQGLVLTVDNLSDPDSLEVTVRKNSVTPLPQVGLVVLSRNLMRYYKLTQFEGDSLTRHKVPKNKLLSGVSRVVLFDIQGDILCDRLFYADEEKRLAIRLQTEKDVYEPFELVEMDFFVTDKDSVPVQTTFSLSIRDHADKIKSKNDIRTDLLLMSEVKGYVRNPSYYFEADDHGRRAALDVLLMVQGWRRYDWKQMAGLEPIKLDYFPEQGIEVHGQVVSFVKSVPKPNVEVSLFLRKREESDMDKYVAEEDESEEEIAERKGYVNGDKRVRRIVLEPESEDEEKDEPENFPGSLELFTTDSLGRFAFITYIQGKYSMILAVTEKGKRKDYRIVLDRVFNPAPRRYNYTEMQVELTDEEGEKIAHGQSVAAEGQDDDSDKPESLFPDEPDTLGIDKKTHRLAEVVVRDKRRYREREIYQNRSKSFAYYDVSSELDDIKDHNNVISDDIHLFLRNMNNNFLIRHQGGEEYLTFKNKKPLFVINYQRTNKDDPPYYRNIRLEAIKSIYLSQDYSSIMRYADTKLTMAEIMSVYSCVVFIETYPEGKIPVKAGKGVRKTWLDGYSIAKEFYNPDYSELPPEPDDYRRTLYWNPYVSTSPEGKTQVRFYNNSRSREFDVDVQGITPEGVIGVYKNN